MKDAPMPGLPVDCPLPPSAVQAWGYEGEARYVAFHVHADLDDLIADDGRRSGNVSTWCFQAYRRHRAVGGTLEGAGIGTDGRPATHCLLIDSERNRATIAPLPEARAFLRDQWPPPEPPTPEQAEAARPSLDDLLNLDSWRQDQVDPEAVFRAMDEQRGRVGRMISWLNMAPAAPARGR